MLIFGIIGNIGKGLYNLADRKLFGGGLPGGAPRGGTSVMTGRTYQPQVTGRPGPMAPQLPVPRKMTKWSILSGRPGFARPLSSSGAVIQRPPTSPVQVGTGNVNTQINVGGGQLVQAIPSSRQAILWISQYPIKPSGHKMNKSSYFRTDPQTGQIVYIPARSVWVRYRRRNNLNAKAADRAADRLDGAARTIKKVFGSSYIIKRKPPSTRKKSR